MAGRPHTRERERLQALREQQTENQPAIIPHYEPAAYSDDLIPELLTLGERGLSTAEMAAHWCISEDELKEWENAHHAFAAALRRARTRAKATWERWIREATASGDNRFPAGSWSHYMRAKHPDYEEKGTTIRVDVTKHLVIVDLRTPEPVGDRLLTDGKPLIEGEIVQREAGLTGEKTPR